MTSNTLQFGGTAELYASVGPVAVAALLNFDALVQQKPFMLQVDLTVSAAVLVDSSPLLTIGVDLHIVGPDPWQITGEARVNLLATTYTVPLNLTIGAPAAPLPPVSVNLLDRLVQALNEPHNWQTQAPAGPGIVSLRGDVDTGDTGSVVHPLGRLSVLERVLPLRVVVDRVGPDVLDTPATLDLGAAQINGVGATSTLLLDYFAPAQFVSMSDADRLSAPSFEQMGAGITVGTLGMRVADDGTTAATAMVVRSTRLWTTLTVDTPDVAGIAPAGLVVSTDTTRAPTPALLDNQLGAAAAAVNGASGTGAAAYAGPLSGVALTAPSYAAARPDPAVTLRPISDNQGTLVIRVPSYVQTLDRIAGATGPKANAEVVFSSELPGSTEVGVGAPAGSTA
jgi:hypothetical protein